MQKQCKRGHFYDSSKYAICPYCPSQEAGVSEMRTMAEDNILKTQLEEKLAKKLSETDDSIKNILDLSENDSRTMLVGLGDDSQSFEPIVGWLVAITGKNKGRDYKIRAGRNMLGRGEDVRIKIDGDPAISRHQAVIIYDEKKNIFSIAAASDSTTLVYVNDNAVEIPQKLKVNDLIEMGNTKLVFMPLCSEQFKWSDYLQ